jgi:hypothetical protein
MYGSGSRAHDEAVRPIERIAQPDDETLGSSDGEA